MILTALRTGLRVSELTHLTCDDVRLGTGAHVHCMEREGRNAAPRWTSRRDGPARLAHRAFRPARRPAVPGDAAGVMSRDAFQARLDRLQAGRRGDLPVPGIEAASPPCFAPFGRDGLRRAGVDTSVIALWLGHEDSRSTQVYIHADLR